jgi:hypothetical protein
MRSAPAAHHWTDSFRDLRWAPRHCSTSSHGAGVRRRVCLLSQSPYPNFLSQAQESFVTQFCASASVAKPGTSISGRSGNLTMTSHPDPIFMGRGSNLILATDLANGGLRARCLWNSGNAHRHVYPMGKMRPGLRLPQSSWHSEAEGFSAQRRSRLSSRSSRKYRVTAKSASRIARTIQILTWRIKLARHVREFNQPTRKPLLPTAKVRRPLAQRAQMASVGQITELTLTGRSCTKGSKMAVQSARPGHDIHIIMEPGSREVRGPGMRASALVLRAHALAGRQ